jgi:hypothetical protein
MIPDSAKITNDSRFFTALLQAGDVPPALRGLASVGAITAGGSTETISTTSYGASS